MVLKRETEMQHSDGQGPQIKKSFIRMNLSLSVRRLVAFRAKESR